MFHSGFSGARQALSAILLNSSESLPRADRDGARGLLLPSQPTCCHSAPREGSAPSPIRPGSRHPTTLPSPCSLLICAQLAGSLPHPLQPPTPAS